jgi:hypothetical protein
MSGPVARQVARDILNLRFNIEMIDTWRLTQGKLKP